MKNNFLLIYRTRRYGADSTRGSCVFKFITPAWSNNNLRNLGDYIYSNLIMAHVRAASSGHDHTERVIVSNENCHPFKFGRWTFMHNGGKFSIYFSEIFFLSPDCLSLSLSLLFFSYHMSQESLTSTR